MRVRAIDINGDWTFGKGQNDYKTANDAIAQNIRTRLYSVLGNCFFDQGAGINWFGFIGGKDQTGLNLSLSAAILNTQGVIGLVQLSSNLDTNLRKFSVSYSVTTIYTGINLNANPLTGTANFLVTDSGFILITDSGFGIEVD